MRAGSLRHRIVIERPTTTRNAFGEPVETWESFAEAWASHEDIAGSEGFTPQQIAAEVVSRFTMRYLASVTARMRICSEGQTYNITAITDPDGKRRTLSVLAKRQG